MRKLFIGAAALLCAQHSARAQSAGESSHTSLTISIGAAQENRRDDSDSPLAYAGSGPAAHIDYDWARGGRRTYVTLAGAGSQLTPSRSIASFRPQEEFSAFAVQAGMSWRIRPGSALTGAPDGSSGNGGAGRGDSPRGGAFALGVEFAASATIARHNYEMGDVPQQNFVLGLVTLAPTARWTRRVGAGEFAAALAVPLIALVDHPYADVRYATQLSKLRVVALSQFHQASGELSYAFRPEGVVGITASYRLGAMELNDLEPVRRVSQSLSLGVVRRFGAWR